MFVNGTNKIWLIIAFTLMTSCATRIDPAMIYYDSAASRQTGEEIIVTKKGIWGFELQHLCQTRCRYICRNGTISKSQFDELAAIDWDFLRETQFIVDEPNPDELFTHLEVYADGKIVGQHLPSSQFVKNMRAMEAATRIEKLYVSAKLSPCNSDSNPFNDFRPTPEKAEWYFHYDSRPIELDQWSSRTPYFALVRLLEVAFRDGQSGDFECSLHPTVNADDLRECEK